MINITKIEDYNDQCLASLDRIHRDRNLPFNLSRAVLVVQDFDGINFDKNLLEATAHEIIDALESREPEQSDIRDFYPLAE